MITQEGKKLKHNWIREIELLAPARDLPTAIAAINHGADAVYIGAPRFSARQAVGASISDIAELCRYAHLFRAKVLVALNTILYDDEVKQAVEIIYRLYAIGADAVIIQDRGLLTQDLPPIALHASTQCDNRRVQDVQELESLGFTRVVLARELSIPEIRTIKESTSIELETFVHGALCVSYSGACYLSAATCNRSANRGSCSQPCRLPYNLFDASGQVILEGKHLLSLRDMRRSVLIPELIAVGISSLKIEGRLKSTSYVKNITAHYSKIIDDVIARYPDKYKRASEGTVTHTFEPDPTGSFNRGFTDYLLNKQDQRIKSWETPKSRGRYIGQIAKIYQERGKGYLIQIDRLHGLHNGDGLLVIDSDGEVDGFRVNEVSDTHSLRISRKSPLRVGSAVYCNHDTTFEKILSSDSSTRRIPVKIRLRQTNTGLAIDMTGSATYPAISSAIRTNHIPANTPQAERIRTELSKLGSSVLSATDIDIEDCQELFIPASTLASLRRQAVETFVRAARLSYKPKNRPQRHQINPKAHRLNLPYSANIANRFARMQYERMGYQVKDLAYELSPNRNVPLMTTKLCIRRELGYCPKLGQQAMPYREPLFMETNRHKNKSTQRISNNRLRLAFDCQRCYMLVYAVD